MTEHYETLRIELPQPQTVLVTLHRPEAANAMNTQMGLDLFAAFERFHAAPNAQRCVVITGTGARAFCAGGDLKERNGMTDQQWQDQHLIFERAIRHIMFCPVPIIAAVNGAAYAGGLEISLCADFIYAAEHARFALTEVTLGIMPGAGGTQTLPRAVGARRAKEILLTGTPFTAQQALEWGMVNRLCKAETLLHEALETAGKLNPEGKTMPSEPKVGSRSPALRNVRGPRASMERVNSRKVRRRSGRGAFIASSLAARVWRRLTDWRVAKGACPGVSMARFSPCVRLVHFTEASRV